MSVPEYMKGFKDLVEMRFVLNDNNKLKGTKSFFFVKPVRRYREKGTIWFEGFDTTKYGEKDKRRIRKGKKVLFRKQDIQKRVFKVEENNIKKFIEEFVDDEFKDKVEKIPRKSFFRDLNRSLSQIPEDDLDEIYFGSLPKL